MRKILGIPEMAEPEAKLLGGRSSAIQWGRLFLVLVVVGWLATPAIGFVGSLTFLTGLGFAASFIGFSRPAIGVLGISLVCTLDPITRYLLTTSLLRWNTFNYWLVAVMLISITFVWRVADIHSRFLKMFIVLLTVELLFSAAMENGIQHILGVATLFGLLVYFAQAQDDPDIWYMVGLVNATVGALGGFMYLLVKSSLPEINPNAWALFPETAIFAACLGFWHAAQHPRGQLTLAVLAGVNGLWTFFSGSRGGMLIAAVGMIFIILTMKRIGHRFAFAVVSVVIVLGALTVFSGMENTTMHRINKLLDDSESTSGRTNGRSDLALGGIHIFKQNPFGVGTGGFGPAWADLGYVPGLSSFKRGEVFPAHAAWIKVIAENGWPGILLLIAYVGSFTVRGLQLRSGNSVSLGILVSAAMTITFLSVEFQGKGIWMLAAGATAQLNQTEMMRCLTAEVRRFMSRPRRVLGREPQVSQPPVESPA